MRVSAAYRWRYFAPSRYHAIMTARRKTTMYIDEDLLNALKIAAIRAGKKEYELVEDALRARYGLEALLERTWARNASADADDVMNLAIAESKAVRAARTERERRAG